MNTFDLIEGCKAYVQNKIDNGVGEYSYFTEYFDDADWIDFVGALTEWRQVKVSIDGIAMVHADRIAEGEYAIC